MTGLFLQPPHASGTLYHLIFHLVFVPQNSSLFSKLVLCHRFSMTNFVVSVFLCVVFCFWFYCALNTQQGGYVCITSVIIIIIIIKIQDIHVNTVHPLLLAKARPLSLYHRQKESLHEHIAMQLFVPRIACRQSSKFTVSSCLQLCF